MTLRQLLIGRSLGRSLIRGLSMALALLLGSWFILVPVRAHGPSMTPTYSDRQLLLVNRLAYRFGEVRRGDVVAITLNGAQAVLVKRIIGLPGERIRIDSGQVMIRRQAPVRAVLRLSPALEHPRDAAGARRGVRDRRQPGDAREVPRFRPRRPQPDPRPSDQLRGRPMRPGPRAHPSSFAAGRFAVG